MSGHAQNGVAQPESVTQRILLLGYGGTFPSILMRLVAEEFPNLAIDQLEDWGDLREAGAQRTYNLVLVDESQCERLLEDVHLVSCRLQNAVVALTFSGNSVTSQCIQKCMDTGKVTSFLSMDTRIEVWLSAVALMLRGGRYVAPMLLDEYFTCDHSTPVPNGHADHVAQMKELTPREMEVLDLVSRGLQNKIIAADLGLSENTVKLHLHHIITKLHTSNRTEAAACYHVYKATQRASGDAL